MISKNEVKKLAELSLLAVDDAEIETLTKEIDDILEYVKDVDEIASKHTVVDEKPLLYNVYREDVVTNEPGEYTEKIVKEMPDTEGNYLRVKKIL
jgi:aspartyl-tRNA(Asn)/glutamyl-tRNA(Gln) amidotransferase subunit C